MSTATYTIAICTYNRASFLRMNLAALAVQEFVSTGFEVVVVDNNSSDDTADTVKEMQQQIPGLRYVLEKEQGLSFARNRAYREARTPIVVYLDDDAIPGTDFLTRVEAVKKMGRFRAWGGIVNPWFPEGRPHWLKDRYVAARLPYSKLHPLTRSNDFFSGGVMVMEKSLLEEYGGFDTELGMRGNTIAYGEETALQVRMKAGGVPLGYDPELQVWHATLPHKLNVDWFFRYSFAAGRDMIRVFGIQSTPAALLYQLLAGVGVTGWNMVRYTPRLLLQSDYYIENWLIDVFRKLAKRLGTVYYGILTWKSEGSWRTH